MGPAGKKSAHNVGDLGSIPGLGRSPGEGNGYPLQYSGLENSMDCIVHGVAKSQTQLKQLSLHINVQYNGDFLDIQGFAAITTINFRTFFSLLKRNTILKHIS